MLYHCYVIFNLVVLFHFSTAFSSLDSLDHPVFLSQGYLLPFTHVNAMTVTNTERGITHKNLLLALESGYIHTIPKNLLDPRRSFQQTPQLEEEGLIPYVPELPLHPMAFVNYNKTGTVLFYSFYCLLFSMRIS